MKIIYVYLVFFCLVSVANSSVTINENELSWVYQNICSSENGKCKKIDLTTYQGNNHLVGVVGVDLFLGNDEFTDTAKNAWLLNARSKLEEILNKQNMEVVQKKGSTWWVKLKS